jgi:hypothetical protein
MLCVVGGKSPLPHFFVKKLERVELGVRKQKIWSQMTFVCLFIFVLLFLSVLESLTPTLRAWFPTFRATCPFSDLLLKLVSLPHHYDPLINTPLHFRIHFTLVPCVPQVKQEHFQMFGGYNEVTMISFLIWLSISKEKGRETSCRSCRNIKHSSLYVNKYMYTVHIL